MKMMISKNYLNALATVLNTDQDLKSVVEIITAIEYVAMLVRSKKLVKNLPSKIVGIESSFKNWIAKKWKEFMANKNNDTVIKSESLPICERIKLAMV